MDQPTPDALDAALLKAIGDRGSRRNYPANAVLIHEGDDADSLFIVIAGRVKVFARSADGKEFVLAVHGPSEYVGELALDGGVRSASVITLEPTTCSVLNNAQLRAFIVEHPDFALHLIHKLIRRLRQATDSAKSLALENTYARIVRLLRENSEPIDGRRQRLREPFTHQQIADRVGSSREMVSRILKDLALGGYISIEGRHLVVDKPPPAAW